ncbi:response regulator transcription factor [Paenibacillus arenilitoris]|uniref:Helix-turn-helix domain-containing protein n=1 Tax=Paenibacillus arenilitoris TaxID=2772299 RepID=A0A927H3N7_9BACL|nr:helix-turn-helix domain-containing protein [Paenibacillus arenilitoris]MBD2867050.1 helix-turn-helix domain-containing protein [Paenibacillus arenilitoris]
MYRLLIVDDEEIITNSLYEVFHRLMSDSLDICRAYSARGALDWLSRTRIDIVLTDIRMPGMNGLELTQEIRSFWPRCRIVFLTGFSEFDYAYQAIQMPNARYLLKTEGYDKVSQTVEDVVQELNRELRFEQLAEKSREQTDALALISQGDYFRHFLQESSAMNGRREELVRDFEELNIVLSPNAPVLLALGRVSYKADTGYAGRSKVVAAVRRIWSSFMSEQTRSIGVVDKQGDMLWFIQPTPDAGEKFNQHLLRYLEGTLELVQEACLASLQAAISFTVNGALCEWEEVTLRYERLRRLQQSRIGDGLSMILIDRAEESEADVLKEGTSIDYKIAMLEAHLEGGKASEFLEELEALASKLLHGCCGSVQKTIEGYYAIALVLLSYMNRMGLHGQLGEYGKLMRLDDHGSMKDAFVYLRETAQTVFRYKNKDERDRASQVIERICQFIEEHLDEDLSLVRLAELHYFNPSYLSRFFKQEFGMNVSEYIDKCRLRKAKELLRNHEMKVRDVASAVGYEAAHSFTRFFKKMTGLTPQEYRDNLI